MGRTAGRDQSYVLCSLTQDQLAHTLFPLGGLHKDQVRAIAAEQGLCNARKRDSQDLCFVPGGDYVAFLERYTGQPCRPGPFWTGPAVFWARTGARRPILLASGGVWVWLCRSRSMYAPSARRRIPLLWARNATVRLRPAGGGLELDCRTSWGCRRANAKIRYRQVEQPSP